MSPSDMEKHILV